ncbi:ABC1-domain-containing protein [Mycena sanguinolenta]|uniref:ABC1-domain-containing protein n=1 Tax=Mycena sanguinolenta TaxID=230812 RepID=A0A8H6XF83_9AGAR|nr:ABC1-domain-containing protein [Mycena sanguinolenta]
MSWTSKLSSLPPGLRTSLLSPARPPRPYAPLWARHASYLPQGFFTRTPIQRFSLRRTAYWLVPIAGGLVLYFRPEQTSLIPSIIASPTIIPCQPPPGRHPVIASSSDYELTIGARILAFFHDRIWEPLLTAKRFVYLFALFIPVILSSPMLLIGKPEKRYRGDTWGAVWWYNFLVSTMETAGPAFIKLAQWAGSRADLFPSLLCDRLGRLHSSGKPHSMSHTRKQIEKVFQRPFEEIFEEFDEEPIGTGAIAQVYRATLKQDLIPPSYLGPRRQRKGPASALAPVILQDPPPSVPTASVAIKVLHPHVRKTISRDLSIMSFFAHFITLFPGMQWLSLVEEVDVFGRMMFQQLDLRHEAENLLGFEANFASRKVPVTFPRPLVSWSTTNMLVEEYENALPLEAFLKNGGGPFEDQVATNMLLLDNFVHSDLHPGNIMIKFSKPATTRFLLGSIFRSLFHKGELGYEVHAPDSDSDQIVSELHKLIDDPAAWRAKLNTLGAEGYIPEIVFIDAGLVTTLSEVNRKNFLDLFRAMAQFDGYRTGQLMVERCRTPELAIETETFALKMQHLVLSVKRKTFSLGQIKISDILTEVLKAVREHHVKMEGDFVNTVISILLLEGIGRQLDPGLDLFKSALPILRQLGGQMAASATIESERQTGNLGAMLKLWVWVEARQLISASIVNADDSVKYGWLMPTI